MKEKLGKITEKMLRNMIPDILEKIGSPASKQDIINFIEDNYILTKEDAEKSNTRNEPKWHQRAGNIVSHAKKSTSLTKFEEGFYLYKIPEGNKTRYYFSQYTLEDMEDDYHNGKARAREKTSSRKKSATHKKAISEKSGRKINWDKENDMKSSLGKAGERYVAEVYEHDYIDENCPSEMGRLKWISEDEGDGTGYDILSVSRTDHLKNRYIEVKSTNQADACTRFFLSRNERRTMESFLDNHKYGEEYYLYRCFNPNEKWTTFDVKEITAEEILSDAYTKRPVTYEVTPA